MLRELLGKQQNLNDKIFKNNNIDITDTKVRKEIFNNTLIAIFTELGEFANEVKTFKHWSKKPDFFNTEFDNRRKVLGELVDILHFFLSIILLLGFSADEVIKEYYIKNEENHRRQKEGY